jgi:protein phosphatase
MRETLKYAGSTHVGLVRTNNEDAFYLPAGNDELPFFCVLADGMGGHSKGELASSLAVEYVSGKLHEIFDEKEITADMGELLAGIVQKANVKIYLESLEQNDAAGMGTTLTILVIEEDNLWIAHVGDCRAYVYRDKNLIQLTVDQTVAQEMLDSGSLKPEELSGHPRRNILTQALGIPEFLQPEIIKFERKKQDRYILCSDGLYGQVSDQEILNAVKSSKDPQAVSELLLNTALENGGEDNITVLVIVT